MGTILKVLVAIPAILFTVFGLRWAVDPGGAATQFGMPLLEGLGLSTQAGDLTAFFLGLGVFIFAGLITENRAWLQAAATLLGLTAIFRTLAWLVHGAAFAPDMIAPEVIFSLLLFFAASRLPAPRTGDH